MRSLKKSLFAAQNLFSIILKFATLQDFGTATPQNRNSLELLFPVFQRSHHIHHVVNGVIFFNR